MPDITKIRLPTAALCGLACIAIAIAADLTILPGRGKAVFLASFVLSMTALMFKNHLARGRVLTVLGLIAGAHILAVPFAPADHLYPGAVLSPLGLADIVVCYFVLQFTVRLDQRSTT